MLNPVPPKLLGLTGRARAGKSTVAAHLVRAHGYAEDSFAAPIRSFMCSLLGVDLDGLDALKERPLDWLPGYTPRRLMQEMGTEWGRMQVSPTLWIDACLMRASEGAGRVVISDVRFNNEAAAIRAMGGRIIEIWRPGTENNVRKHVSEEGVDRKFVDDTVPNDGRFLDLFQSVEAAVSRLALK